MSRIMSVMLGVPACMVGFFCFLYAHYLYHETILFIVISVFHVPCKLVKYVTPYG